jgi:hypothetical protein
MTEEEATVTMVGVEVDAANRGRDLTMGGATALGAVALFGRGKR